MDPNTASPSPQQDAPTPAPLFQTPSLPPEMPSQQKKKPKLLLVFAGILVLFVVVIVGAVLLTGSDKKSNTGSTNSGATYNSKSEATEQSEAFLALLSEGKTEEAVLVFKPASQQTKQQFLDRVATVNYLKTNYPVAECQTNGSTTQDTVVVYTCKNSSNKEITIQFTARKVDGKTVLSDLIILNESSAS